MKQVNIAICDDERIAVNTISGTVENILQERGIVANIERFTSAKELENYCEVTHLDLVLLDIEMPNINGIELGWLLRKLNPAPEIIYVSNKENQVFRALRLHPFGFVRKAHFIKDMGDVMNSYLNFLQSRIEEKIIVISQEGYLNVPISTIVYFEGSGSYQQMYLKEELEPVRITCRMKKLEEYLEVHGFLRIHKGFLINYSFIERINTGSVLMSNGKLLPISRGKTAEIKSEYLTMCRKKGIMLF
jgi:DNA-binding LytR/AlgR family response regulator